jgi:hypothetical protein
MSITSLSGWLKRRFKPARAATVRRVKSRRPRLEALEERALLAANLFVVPISTPADAAHFHSLAGAVGAANSGDTITIEPGASPDAGQVTVNVSNLTIHGDPNVPGSVLPRYDLLLGASNVTMDNLNLGAVQAAATANHETITHSQLISFTEQGALLSAGHNTLSQDVITGFVDLQGNSIPGQATGDVIDHDTFTTTAGTALKLTNSSLTQVLDNTILDDSLGATAIDVRSNSDHVLIANNRVQATGWGVPAALFLENTSGAGNILSATVLDNTFDTGGTGTGLYVSVYGTGSGMVAMVQGNDFRDNKVGVTVAGVPGLTGAGNIDLGGASTSLGHSLGGNNFRGFDGNNGHYSIQMFDTDSGVVVAAHDDIFDNGIYAHTTVSDGTINGGTGVVSIVIKLSPDESFVQSLYHHLLGRTGTIAEIDAWVAALPALDYDGVVHAILYSSESLGRVVDSYYLDYLGRAADAPGRAGWVSAIQQGVSLEAVQAGFLASPEYQGHINTDFVQSLYLNVLHRTGSAAELAGWNSALPQLGLAGVAAAFTASTENRVNTTTEYYQDLLGRTPQPGEAASLASGVPGDLLALEAAVLDGGEYYANG